MNPDKIHGPLIANAMQKLCEVIAKESGASTVKVKCEFTYTKGKGELKISTFTSPDSNTERLLEPDVVMPRGSKLQQEVSMKLRGMFSHLTKRIGGK
jgi:hypothetical protein